MVTLKQLSHMSGRCATKKNLNQGKWTTPGVGRVQQKLHERRLPRKEWRGFYVVGSSYR